MKATYKGEPGGPETVTMHGIEFPVGKAVDVPEEIGVGRLLGNPYFTLDGASKDDLEAGKAEDIKRLENDVSAAQNDVDNAKSGGEKASAQKRLDAAKSALDSARK